MTTNSYALSAVCVCGHVNGDHCIGHPDPCVKAGCTCPEFRLMGHDPTEDHHPEMPPVIQEAMQECARKVLAYLPGMTSIDLEMPMDGLLVNLTITLPGPFEVTMDTPSTMALDPHGWPR